MKHCGYCKRDLSSANFATRKASPDGLAYKCRDCEKAYRAANRERYRSLRRAHYERNLEHERAQALDYYRANREHCIARHAEYKRVNDGKMRQYRRDTLAQYVARTALRRASIAQRTPKWLSAAQRAEMARLYRVSAMCTALSGVPHHVDHIVPLRGEFVSGLHVPWNLRVVQASINLSKGNRFDGLFYPPAASASHPAV